MRRSGRKISPETQVQITHDSDKNNARSESAIVVNPNNPDQIVAASKKFKDIHNYDFTLATSYSADGGYTWQPSADVDLGSWTLLTDPTVAWDDQNNVYLVGLPGTNPPGFKTVGIAVWKSTDGGQTWGPPKLIHTSGGDDKQWAAGDTNQGSPYAGRVYAVWDEGTSMAFARTLDHGANWIGTGANPAGTHISSTSFSPEINVAADGTVYIVWISGSQISMLVSTDGGASFQLKTPPATGVATLSAGLPHPNGWPVFPGASFRALTVPTACVAGKTVIVAWDDFREGASRIYYAVSKDGGTSWVTGNSGQPLLTSKISSNLQHFFPQIVVGPYDVIGCAFYEYGLKFTGEPTKQKKPLIDVILATSSNGGQSFAHRIITDKAWDPVVDAPWAHGDKNVTFIGDYFGIDASWRGFHPCWTDTRTGIQELWTDVISVRPPKFPHYDIVATIIDGIINDGGGDEIVGGHLVHIDPWGPPELDILAGIAAHKIASLVRSPEGKALGRAAMTLVVRVAEREIARLGGEVGSNVAGQAEGRED